MKHLTFIGLICISLTACGPSALWAPQTGSQTLARTAQSSKTTGPFTEYALPAGIDPSDLTRGPYDTVYFTSPGSINGPATVWEMAAATGQINSCTAPSPYVSSGFDSIVGLNDSVYYVVKIPVNEDEFYFARVTPNGTFSFVGAPYFEYGVVTNLTPAPPNATSFAYGYCADPCQGPTSGVAGGAQLDNYFVPTGITGGPGGYLYATAVCTGPCDTPSDSRVYVISESGTVLHRYRLPNGSHPAGIIDGSDHNLWITEPGINKIARMTPGGVATQFAIPTANSSPDRITQGYDGAQFFTERATNKIGRITTSGAISEYTVPTANSQPTGIAPCSQQNCGRNGGVWFTETAANKVGRFDAPN